MKAKFHILVKKWDIPIQQYNVDSKGNVEGLHLKRNSKRKLNEMIEGGNHDNQSSEPVDLHEDYLTSSNQQSLCDEDVDFDDLMLQPFDEGLIFDDLSAEIFFDA